MITKDFLNNAGYLLPEDVRLGGDQMNKRRSYGISRPSGSMGSGGAISTWATMKLLGNEGIRTLLEHTLELTNLAYQRVQISEFLDPLFEPELNTVLFSLKNFGSLSRKTNNAIVRYATNYVAEKGYYISNDDEITHGRKIFRFLAMHPFSTEEGVNELIDLLEEGIVKINKTISGF